MSITKFGKKLLCFVALVMFAVALIGCGNTEKKDEALATATEHVESIYKKLLWDDTAMSNITSDLVFTTKTMYDDTTVRWTSSREDIISTSGSVTLPGANDVDATLIDPSNPESTEKHVSVKIEAIITATYGDNKTFSKTKSFNFTVKCFAGMVGTIEEVKAAAYNYAYVELDPETGKPRVEKAQVSASSVTYSASVTGKVTAMLRADGTGQFMIHDGTDGIYVYYAPKDVQVGDTVTVYGNIYPYYGNFQFGSDISVKKVEDREFNIPEHKETSIDEWETSWSTNPPIGYYGGQLISVYAKLVAETQGSDKYAICDPYTGTKAWIYYKSYNDEEEEILKSYLDKYVILTGVTYDRDTRYNSNHLLWDGSIKEAAAPSLSDEQKLTVVKSELSTIAGSYASGTSLVLPTTNEEYGATITWTIPANAPYANGKFAVVESDTKVTFTAEIEINGKKQTIEIEIIVKAVSKVDISKAITLAKGTAVKLEGTVEAIFGSKGYFYLKDSTGTLLIYTTTKEGISVNGTTVTIKAGDKLSLTGTMNYFNGTPQIGEVLSYDSHEAADWEISTPTEVTFAELKALTANNSLYGKYLMLRGFIVSDEKYFLFNETRDAGSISISLFNSNVPNRLKEIKDSDTQATLFFYFYGNSKADYSGALRVIFCGRDGEYFIGDEEVVIPTDKDPLVKEPVVETAYVLGLRQENLNKDLYLSGVMSGNFFGTTEKPSEAARVYLETATDGYYLYALVAGAKKYVSVTLNDSNKNVYNYVDTPDTVWTYNTEYNTLVTKLGENELYLGTYKTFDTISASNLSYIKTSFPSHLFDPAKLSDPEEPKPSENTITFTWEANMGTIKDNVLTIEQEGYTLVLDKNLSTADTNNTYPQLRIYQGAIFSVIVPEGKKIASISFVDLGGKKPTSVTLTDSNLSFSQAGNTWTITAAEGTQKISFQADKQMRFTSLVITFAE